jgi:hypothetical protein
MYVFSPVGGGGVWRSDFYGWAAIPPEWLDRLAGFAVVDVTDDPVIDEQVVVTLHRAPA